MTAFRRNFAVKLSAAVCLLLSLLIPAAAQGPAAAQEDALRQARQLSAQADQLSAAAKYDEALPLAERVLALRQQALGQEHAEVALALDQLATIYRRKGDLAKAEPLAVRALAMAEKTFKPNDSNLGLLVNDLAVIHFTKRDYLRAEPLFLRARSIWEQTLGIEHPNVGRVLNNLGAVYANRGENDKAAPLLQRALEILEKELGPEHMRVGDAVNNLANFHAQQREDFARAEPLFARALGIYEKQLGPEDLRVATALYNLGNAQLSQGNLAQAEANYGRARKIFETKNIEHPDALRVFINLGELAALRGDYAQSLALQQRALALREKALGPEHPDVALQLNALMRVHAAKGEWTEAIRLQSRACALSERNLKYNLAGGSERQKLAFLSTLFRETNRTISLHGRLAPNDGAARDLALTAILQRKGRALDAMTDSIAALRRRATPEDQKLLDQLKETRAQLASLILNGPQRTPPAEHQNRIKALEAQREKLEDEISRRSAEFRVQQQPVTLPAVQAAIPANAALVELIAYRPFNPRYSKVEDQFGQSRYVAYVLHRQGEAKWVDLGEQQPIDAAVEKLRRALRDRTRRDVKQLAREVDRMVMQPIRPLLGKTRRVFLSPDGALNLVPFAAFVDEHRHYLIQHYTFSYLTSGRDLLRLQTRSSADRKAMVIANPDFGEDAPGAAPAERILKYRPGSALSAPAPGAANSAPAKTAVLSILADAYFPTLPGTADEARALAAALPGAEVYVQTQATETVLKQARAPRLLHVATHGFFLEDEAAPSVDSRILVTTSTNSAAPMNTVNPLLRSGLALAGANRRQQAAGEDDGILTAMEAAGLDLNGTQLVVLSACNTGVGEARNGDGVYGLRRALFLAGSETQVMSLWPASDLATRDLMIGYYQLLQRGEGRATALRQAQLRLLAAQPVSARKRKQDYSHPYYWANFIPSGEWANLEGQRER